MLTDVNIIKDVNMILRLLTLMLLNISTDCLHEHHNIMGGDHEQWHTYSNTSARQMLTD